MRRNQIQPLACLATIALGCGLSATPALSATPDAGGAPNPATRPLPATRSAPVGRPGIGVIGPREFFNAAETATISRIKAMQFAAEDAPLEEPTRRALSAEIASASRGIGEVEDRYVAGDIQIPEARKRVAGIVAKLNADETRTLGKQKAAFDRRATKVLGEALLFSSRNPAEPQLMLDASAKLTQPQKTGIAPLLTAAARSSAELPNTPDALLRQYEIGFDTRTYVRKLLTPEQRQALDGPFDAPTAPAEAGAPPGATPISPGARPPMPASTLPASAAAGAPGATAGAPGAAARPAAGPGEIDNSPSRVIVLTLLQAMRYAALEGPFIPEVKVALAQRIAKARADVIALHAAGPAAGADALKTQVDSIYAGMLADTAAMLKGQMPEFIRRQTRIYEDVASLSEPGPWSGRAALAKVELTDSQKAKVQEILNRLAEAKKTDAAGAPARSTTFRLRERAFDARAEIRDVLTPEQQAQWDAASAR